MANFTTSQASASIPVIGVGADGVLYIVAQVAPGTDLYALGRTMIEAGFVGVREVATNGVTRFWKVRCDTPEGAFLVRLCDLARQGGAVPAPEDALALLRASLRPGEVRV